MVAFEEVQTETPLKIGAGARRNELASLTASLVVLIHNTEK